MTLLPLTCLVFSALGLVLGCVFEPRNIGLMFGFIVLPITFLGGTYYQWTRLAPVKVGGFHWLQMLVLINPLIYVNEGLRAAFTNISHMHLYIIYPVLVGFLRRLPGYRYPGFPPAGAVLAPGARPQRPLNTGSRFSTNARAASRWSSVSERWPWWVTSTSIQSISSPCTARLRFSFM